MLDIINNPLSYFTGAVFGSAFDLNLRCAHIGIEGGIDSLTYQGTFLLKTEMLKQHSTRENLCQRIGKVLT